MNGKKTAWIITFRHAFSGLSHLLKTEKSFHVHFFFAIAAILMLIICQATSIEWAIILLVIGYGHQFRDT